MKKLEKEIAEELKEEIEVRNAALLEQMATMLQQHTRTIDERLTAAAANRDNPSRRARQVSDNEM